jgi:phosphoserine phosphatase RsbX
MIAEAHHTGCVEWSAVTRAAPGETVSGDLHVVMPWSGGTLVAVMDGLGHGEEATFAARMAAAVLARHAEAPVTVLTQQCHEALRQTRGVVMTVASIDWREEMLTAVGVGNVETVRMRISPRVQPRRESVILRGGVVGYQLPPLQPTLLPIAPGDVVVFATDGVGEDFAESINLDDPIAQMADRVMVRNFRGRDDALVLACKYLGAP